MAAAGLTAWTAPQVLDIKPAYAMATTYRLMTTGAAPCADPTGWGAALTTGAPPGNFIAVAGTVVEIVLSPGCSLVGATAQVLCTAASGGPTVSCVTLGSNPQNLDDGSGSCVVQGAWAVISCVGTV